MKRFLIITLFLIPLIITVNAFAFMPFGRTNSPMFKYKDFKRKGDGFTFTLVNKYQRPGFEFYVSVYGYDVQGNAIYRQRFYVEFIEGKGEVSYYLPDYDSQIIKVRVQIFQLPEVDTRPK